MTAYDRDLYAWAIDQAGLLRARSFNEVDADNIAEELDALAKSQRRALASHLRVLLTHLLKWKYQPSARSPSWTTSINGSRDQLEDLLEDNPSLKPQDFLTKAYGRAVRDAADESGLSTGDFPPACPWPIDQVLEEGWLPN